VTLPIFVAQNDNVDDPSYTNEVAVPTGTVEGDVMVAWAAAYGHSTADCFVTPAGWTRFAYEHVDQSDKMTLCGFWKVAGASESATEFTVSGFEDVYFILSVESWRGVNTSAPVDAYATDSDKIPPSPIDVFIPGLTTTVADCAVSGFVTEWNYSGGGLGAVSNWTTTSAFDTGYSAVYRRDAASAGAISAEDTGTNDLDLWLSAAVALKPADLPAVVRTYSSQATSGSTSTCDDVVTVAGDKLIVTFMCRDTTDADRIVSAVERDGQAFTEAVVQDHGGHVAASIWYLDSPNVGTYDVTVEYGGNMGFVQIGVLAVTGVAAGGPTWTGGSSAASGADPQETRDASADSLMVMGGVWNWTDTVAEFAGQTNFAVNASSRHRRASYEIAAGGSEAFGYTAVSLHRAFAIAEFLVAGGGPVGYVTRMWGGSSWDPVVQKVWNGSAWAASTVQGVS